MEISNFLVKSKNWVYTFMKIYGLSIRRNTVKSSSSFDIEDKDIICDTSVAKISIVGAGMESHPGTASKMFEALYNVGVNINMISTSEIRVTVIVDEGKAEKAMNAVHDAFMGVE